MPLNRSLSEAIQPHRMITDLTSDPELDNFCRPAIQSHFAFVSPEKFFTPKLLAWSKDCADWMGVKNPEKFDIEALAGHKTFQSFATTYGGHQFGNWANQLGDGRAIILGEVKNQEQHLLEVQVKGSGATPFSRRGDGKAVLRSSVREFIASEFMHYLRVPTTRALALILTGESVTRDMFYDGHPAEEPGAVVCRVSPTFLRFGHFEIWAFRQDIEKLKSLLLFAVKNFYPEILSEFSDTSLYIQEIAFYFLKEVAEKTAHLMTEWYRVGFTHGVMNTDNMSIMGLTIDYGPYGFLDNYDPAWTPNTTDLPGRRYCFGRQGAIGLWNVECLVESLKVFTTDAQRQAILEHYQITYEEQLAQLLVDKIGAPLNELSIQLAVDIDHFLRSSQIDFTLFYRGLSRLGQNSSEQELSLFLDECSYQPLSGEKTSTFKGLLIRLWDLIKDQNPQKRQNGMNQTNPWIIPRNYQLALIIEALEAGNHQPLDEMMMAMKSPYTENEALKHLAKKRPSWALNKPGCSALSCSS